MEAQPVFHRAVESTLLGRMKKWRWHAVILYAPHCGTGGSCRTPRRIGTAT
jgi:hypothetical protein